MSKTILGLDVGVASIGWALICENERANPDILGMGVRIFEPGYAGPKYKWENGSAESRCKKRRDARGQRRLHRRRAKRLSLLFSLLQEHGLLPAGEGDAPEARHDFFVRLDKELTAKAISDGFSNTRCSGLPYWLRRRALDEPISPYELGRVLYHLGQRRGFKSNRKGLSKDPKETGVVISGIAVLGERIEASGSRTLGEYLAGLDTWDERIRGGRYTSRQMYTDEFNKIWESQSHHHPQVLTTELKEKIHKAIFAQRGVGNKGKVGKCTLEPKSRRASKACLLAQRFCMLQEVNNLRITHPDGEVFTLTSDLYREQRKVLIARLQREGDLTIAQVKKALDLPRAATLNFEEGEDAARRIRGNVTYARFRSFFGESWDELPEGEQDKIVTEAISYENSDALKRKAETTWKLPEERAQALSRYVPEDGYMNLSKKAMRNILPYLEEGLSYAAAVKQVYPDRQVSEVLSFVPPLDVKDSRISTMNPAVRRALSETFKVVNAIIRKYGRPDIIRIELARDVKSSKKDRVRMYKDSQNRAREVERAKTDLLRKISGLTRARRRDIDKRRLWEESQGRCPYCGRDVSLESLISDDSFFEVDHIIPFSRCFNDSLKNKTIICSECNRSKGNKTPREMFGGEDYDRMIERVKDFRGRDARHKLRLFQAADLEEVTSASSQFLTDTRYICTEVARHLGSLYGGVVDRDGIRRVQPTNGRVTSVLRKCAGFGDVLGGGQKNRDDHRHHALDALFVALTSPRMIERIHRASSQGRLSEGKRWWKPLLRMFDEDGFRERVEKALSNITVSHRPQRRLRGELHEQTHYGTVRDGSHPGKIGFATKREKLQNLTPSKMEDIADPRMRCRVIEAFDRGKQILVSRDVSVEVEKLKPSDVFKEKELRPWFPRRDGKKVVVDAVHLSFQKSVVPVGTGARIRYVPTGANDHLEVFERVRENGSIVWVLHAVSLLEARRRFFETGSRFVKRLEGYNDRYLFSIFKGDTLELTPPEGGNPVLAVVRGISDGEVSLAGINNAKEKAHSQKAKGASVDAEWIRLTSKQFQQCQPRRVNVSLLGEVSYEKG